jgi:hypothetical protein
MTPFSSPKNAAAMREARCRLLHDVGINHIDSPCIWVWNEACIPAGPLPSFVDARTLGEALHQLPDGSRRACIKCVWAWRMGHLDARSLREYLRSVAWQSSALQRCATLAPFGRESLLEDEHREPTELETCDQLLSAEEMGEMMRDSC